MPVRFYLYPMPNKKGECPIRVSISIGSTRFMTGIGYNCAVEAWEEGKGVKAKYKDTKFPGGLALPVITNQKMNYYLKDLCELCGFNEPISITCYRAGEKVEETFPKYELIGTHAGRRTFICFALSQEIAPQVVMKWTGHSDYKAMKPYIDIAEKTKAEAMNLFEKGLKK